MGAVKAFALRFLKRHVALVSFVAVASIAAAIVYELTHGGKPHRWVYDDPRLNYVDRTGDKPRAIWNEDEFECIGWRATYGCDPYGERDVTRDRKCDEPLSRVSGYCEVRNATSGEIFRVMLATCKSWRWYLVKQLTCNDARIFTDFSIRAAEYEHPPAIAAPLPPPKKKSADDKKKNNNQITAIENDTAPVSLKRGVVLIGFPKAIAGVYAIIRLLRFHGCALPVEVWIDPLEMHAKHSVLVELVNNYGVFLRVIEDPNATKFHAKPYTIYHSRFESVLFLDSDNIPVRDPTYLFDSPEFTKFGAMFWPDFWRPALDTPFNVQEQSALWQLLDMPFVDMFEQESGQVLVNKSMSAAAMSKLMFYSDNVPRLLTDWELVYGDKDLFRLAWLNTSTPFYFIQHTLALGGLYDKDEDFFCGISMIQRDPAGDFIFLHRNQAKLSGRRDQKVLITHYQKFTGGDGGATSLKRDLDKYRIQCKMHRLGQYICFLMNPKTLSGDATPFLIKSLDGTKYPQVEKQAIHFSIEGRSLLSKTEEAEIAVLEEKELQKQAAETAAELARKEHDNQTWYTLMFGGCVLLLGVLWKLNSYRKRQTLLPQQQQQQQQRPNRPTLGSKDLSLADDASSASSSSVTPSSSAANTANTVRRKRSMSIQYDDQHIL
uniref:Uncharacterized protein n=1 Tax=Globisporangium ultimum (strain ATCC 200006 / CBS 805.95 / DAOM BR144) TaxID=431595 RepID=K3WIB1_GLOUD